MKELIEHAKEAMGFAYVPYSKFPVGCAILLKNGSYYLGCNIENSSYGLTNCAERTAIFKMVSDGYKKEDIKALCVIGNTESPIAPCGACRQVMEEFIPKDAIIYLANLKGDCKKTSIEELLPFSFTKEDLK